MATTLEDRACGALLGAFIGDALALGPHWYYDLDRLHADYGAWVTDYTAPKPGRYHAGLKAGQSSQSGFLLELTLRSLAECGSYDAMDFCRRLDADFFPLIDGTPNNGPGGYTSQSMREAYRLRVGKGLPWGRVGGYTDNTEGAERALALAVRYARDPQRLAQTVSGNVALTQIDPTVGAMTTAYCAALGLVVAGERFDAGISAKLMAEVRDGRLPFHTITGPGETGVADGEETPFHAGHFASPDALLGMGSIAAAAVDPAIRVEPATKAALLYGLPCAVYHQFPSVYYLAARFADNFEAAVLTAVNSGGQNQARAILVGALVGGMVGFSRIPQRFVDGLEKSAERIALARKMAAQLAV
ncbi:MAG: ADP-ribosylglycohydrolase family protein [Nevskiaceae bacterium]|nr:MAG: ADP-ribosylglycohydrolase family protein [Nevskiaceae bacterium]TBR73033.1 MAG: ADP-ribosylglycohydrolase family protein [Nevskiaceae bacterium]